MNRSGVATHGATRYLYETMTASTPRSGRSGIVMDEQARVASAAADAGRPGGALSHRFSAEPGRPVVAAARFRGIN